MIENFANVRCFLRHLILLTLFVAQLSPANATIVYDNTTGNQGFFSPLTDTGYEEGDEITLIGLERNVTLFEVVFYNNSSSASSADVRVRFYRNDGAAGAPGSVLWDSTIDDVIFTSELSLVSFTVPRILVPDSFTWTVQLSDHTTAGSIGPMLFDPLTVGTSEYFFWLYDNGWEKLTDIQGVNPDGSPVPLIANYGVRLTAVPEPTTYALVGLGLAGLGAVRRRKLAA